MTSTYDLALNVVGSGHERAVVATVHVGSRVAELLDALGAPGSTLFRFDRALSPAATLVEAGVMSGETLGLDAPIVVGWRQLGPELRIVGGIGAGLRKRVDGATVVIGRDAGADVVIPSQLVSRRHAELRWTGDGFTVRDLDSRRGVVVDGVSLAAGVAVALPAGTAVALADSVVTMVGVPDAGGLVRPAGPFHAAFIGGRFTPSQTPPQFSLPPSPVSGFGRRSFAPFVVPSAGAVALAAAAGGAPTPVALAATPAAMIVGLLAERGISARTTRRAARAHQSKVADEAQAVRGAASAFAMAARTRHPDPATLLSAAERRASLLWSSSIDAFRPRLGLTTHAGAVPVEADPADLARVDEARAAHLVPATVDFAGGPVALAGPEASLDALALWLVAQAAALLGPHEIDIVVVSDEPARWAWVAWLPHGGDACVLRADALPAMLPPRAAPHRLVVLDRPASTVWYDAAVTADTWQLWRVGRVDAVPSRVATIVSATGDASVRVETLGAPVEDVLGDIMLNGPATATDLALHLGALRSPLGAAITTPERVVVSDLIPSVTSSAATVRAWQHARDDLEVIVGTNEAGPVRVRLTGQNSHVLVAGTTGSGKTRLLETLAVGLASTYSPAALNLLVIDFKGGNELAGIARLPHCVGLVSDRDMSEVDRVLAALTREIARRDEVFGAAGATDLSDYSAKTGRGLPRLVVIADEFGQFRRDDALGQRVGTLLRIAAQGRSKGLHLVLATQSPSTDVTAEIRQNVGVRMCLRVAEAAESVAVLGVPDAARLTQPGRVMVSVDNEMQVAQVALSRAAVSMRDRDAVVVRDLTDAALAPRTEPTAPDSSLFDAIIDSLTEASATNGSSPMPLLGPPLPEHLARRDLRGADRSWSVGGFVIGQRDRPGVVDAAPLTFDPSRDGAITFIGGARSGRTHSLLALAEAVRDQSDEAKPVALHAIDWSGGLSVLEGARCDAGLVRRGDFEHLRRLVRWLASDGVPGVSRLVLVDRLDSLVRDLRDLDGGAFAAEFLDVLQSGPRRDVFVAVTIEPAALLAGPAALAGRRVVLSIDDASVAVAAGLPRRTSASPGRGVVLPEGDDVQIASAAAPSPGAASGAAVGALPTRVLRAEMPSVMGERIVIGVGGGTTLGPIVVDLDELGPLVAVIGRAGSGRSTALDTIAATYAGARQVVRISRSQPSDWTPAAPPSLVIVDDASRAAATHPWMASADLGDELEARGHVLIAAFEQSDLTTLGYAHWLMRRPCPGLLLALDATADRVIAGERLGFHAPAELRAGPAGRGWWCGRGRATAVQVATN